MDQRQVEVVGLQLLQALLEAFNQAVFGEVGDPDLAGDEQFVAGDAAGSDGLAHVGFVFVDLCGVDDPVTELKGSAHRIDDHLTLQTKRTKTESGNRHAGLQSSSIRV